MGRTENPQLISFNPEEHTYRGVVVPRWYLPQVLFLKVGALRFADQSQVIHTANIQLDQNISSSELTTRLSQDFQSNLASLPNIFTDATTQGFNWIGVKAGANWGYLPLDLLRQHAPELSGLPIAQVKGERQKRIMQMGFYVGEQIPAPSSKGLRCALLKMFGV